MNNDSKKTEKCITDEIISEYFGISPLPEAVETTMAYIPFQTDTTQYRPETALKFGTLFSNLNKPFKGGR